MDVITPAKMRFYDMRQIDKDTPSLELMERAGTQITRVLFDSADSLADGCETFKIVLVAGFGNNGGDVQVVARQLKEYGQDVCLIFTGSETQAQESFSKDSKMNFDRLPEKLEILYFDASSREDVRKRIEEADLIVEGIFGTGFRSDRPMRENDHEIINLINDSKAFVIAADIPSGLDGKNGKKGSACIEADLTVAIQLPKTGAYLKDGPDSAGEIIPVDIGIETDHEDVHLVDPDKLLIPTHRRKNSHKYDYGYDLILAGSKGMLGAAAMAASAAVHSGAGLVKCFIDEELYPILASMLPHEAMLSGYTYTPSIKDILRHRKDALLIGPGLGRSREFVPILESLLQEKTPLVIDADALWYVKPLLEELKQPHAPLVLTPHLGEFLNLTGLTREVFEEDPIGTVQEFAKTYGCVLVLKGYRTLIVDPSGEVIINTTGNPGMATAGSGDVLSGILLSFLGQLKDPFEAAKAAVYYHGLAGDWYVSQYGEISLCATDLIHALKEVLP